RRDRTAALRRVHALASVRRHVLGPAGAVPPTRLVASERIGVPPLRVRPTRHGRLFDSSHRAAILTTARDAPGGARPVGRHPAATGQEVVPRMMWRTRCAGAVAGWSLRAWAPRRP